MILKFLFDRIVALVGLLILWPVLLVVAVLVKVKMPGGPAFFVQKRVGKEGKLFDCHKFRTMTVKHNGSTVSVAGDSRITPFGATLRHYKIDELPGLWDVLIGNMSFVGPRPDVPGYADKLQGSDRDVLKLRPGITGPATLKYRLEDEMLADVRRLMSEGRCLPQEEIDRMTDQELAIWYNDNVIYPDKDGVCGRRDLMADVRRLLFCSTVIFRPTGETRQYDFHPFWSYDRPELLVENIMNVIVFIPIGMILGSLLRVKGSWLVAPLIGCSISVT